MLHNTHERLPKYQIRDVGTGPWAPTPPINNLLFTIVILFYYN